jgi:hypothetical protein
LIVFSDAFKYPFCKNLWTLPAVTLHPNTRDCDRRFRVEDTSPRAVCRLARLPERLCGSDGRYHTTSSKVRGLALLLWTERRAGSW